MEGSTLRVCTCSWAKHPFCLLIAPLAAKHFAIAIWLIRCYLIKRCLIRLVKAGWHNRPTWLQ